MINNYEIKDNVLYLYFDLSNEFSNKKFNKESIIDFIKKNKIIFKGSMVAIIVNGIFLGNVYLSKNNNDIKVVDNTITEVIEEIPSKIEDNIIIEDNKITIEESNEEKIEEPIKIVENKIKKETVKTNNKTSTKNEVETKKEEEKEIIKVQEKNKEEVVDKNIYVIIKRSNGDTLKIELEQYLIGVVAAEMPVEFHSEALKAQSIIARTYTLKALKNNKILTDNESTQSYKDDNELKKLWGSNYNKYIEKIKKVVNGTKGIYLTYNNDYIEAVYHSTSNTKTENAKNVWGYSFPYLISVESLYDTNNKSYIKEIYFTYEELSNKLNMNISYDTSFDILSYTEGNRVKEIRINDKIYTGVNLRTILKLRSADFEITKEENKVKITTKGYGHGVGLSQYGANGMANNGSNYKDILLHYYPNTILNYK